MWKTLGTLDIKIRYRRSAIGPFWLTISMAVTIYFMGFLYGHLFKLDLKNYFPYLASGIISWSFISMLIIESNHAFVESANYIKNQPFAISTFIMKIITRNLIIFAHNLLAYLPIMFIFDAGLNSNLLYFLPGLALVCINAYFWGGVLAIIGARYGDFDQIIKSIIQVVFFVTPIMWMPKLLPEKYQWVVLANPFAQFLQLLRNPLIGQPISLYTLSVMIIITVLGILLFGHLVKRYKYRIVYWL